MGRILKWWGKLPNGRPQIRTVSCNQLCDKCIVRFKCYTLLQGEALLLNDSEWKEFWYVLEKEIRLRVEEREAKK